MTIHRLTCAACEDIVATSRGVARAPAPESPDATVWRASVSAASVCQTARERRDRRALRVIVLGAALVLLFGGGAAVTAAQTRGLQQQLANATTLRCTFSIAATGTWTGGTAAAEVTPAKLEVTFTEVSVEDGTAETGTSGIPVVVRHANDYLHLMQVHGSGPLYTTTVLARETAGGRLMAVHTRHEYTDVRLPGFTSRPEMYVGECAIGG